MKSRLAIISMATCVAVFGAAGCGVREGQEKIEGAREVQKQAEDSQHKLEKQLREGQESLGEDR